MIALTNCIGKIYHLILSRRFTDFLTANKYVDNTLQKAFLPGINGCIEHNIALDEIIKDAKIKKKTVHVTFVDLADAFGSVPHSLIIHSLRRNNFPPEIVHYVHNFYSNLQATVHTSSFKSEVFSFKRGVFQGDPLSPIIFLLAFNPILQFLQENSKFGYKIQEENFITLPYADDFCIISTDKRTHQRLMNQVSDKINSMGMKIKPTKCRSFSLSSGKPKIIQFNFENNVIPSISEEEQKFLGRVLFFNGKSEECYNLLENVITKKMNNLDQTLIRDEYKLEIYQMYILPFIRFLLTVHDLPQTYLAKLDIKADQYLKKWAGLPKCATNAILHLNTALNIKKISTLYTETHCVTHCSTRLKGDRSVNLLLDNRLQRESKLSRKKSITVQAERVYQSALNRNMVAGEIPGTTPENIRLTISDTEVITLPGVGGEEPIPPSSKFIEQVKSEAKSIVNCEETLNLFTHVSKLVKQGKTLELSQIEKNDATWQGFIYNLPRGTMKFLLNSAIDTLPTKVNLKLWGKRSSDKCRCGKRETLNHILNGCDMALQEGRYTYRHDTILKYISNCLDRVKFTCYVDIEGCQTPAGGTLPPNLIVSTLRPDIVILDKKKKELNVFELTVPSESRIKISHNLKYQRYQHLISDIGGQTVNIIPFEIGSQTGYISLDNKDHLKKLHKFCQTNIKLKKFKQNISALAVLSSYLIFNSRNHGWGDMDPILPPFPNQ